MKRPVIIIIIIIIITNCIYTATFSMSVLFTRGGGYIHNHHHQCVIPSWVMHKSDFVLEPPPHILEVRMEWGHICHYFSPEINK
uniref:Uncharacterized protein n=1 Tax=Anguilla anguilla TaxID=7936 RepID=A0A0E9PXC8_ANGAN